MNLKERLEVRKLSNFKIVEIIEKIKGTLAAMEISYEAEILPEDYKKLAETQKEAELLANWILYLNEADFHEYEKFLDSPLICEIEHQAWQLDNRNGYRVIKCEDIMQEQKLDELLEDFFKW